MNETCIRAPEQKAVMFSRTSKIIIWARELKNNLYAVKVKRHNVCKRHVAIDTDFKQTERTIFLCVISMGKI